MNNYYCTDGNGNEEIEAESAQAAAQEYVDGGDWERGRKTFWVDVNVTPILTAASKAEVIEIIKRLEAGSPVDFDDHLILSVAEDYNLDKLVTALPGIRTEWAGSSNTSGDGETTEDIHIEGFDEEYHDSDNSERITIEVDPEEPDCMEGEDHDWQSPHCVVGGLKENPGVYGKGGGVKITECCCHCGRYKVTDTWAQRRDTGEQGLRSTEYLDADHISEAWVQSLTRDQNGS